MNRTHRQVAEILIIVLALAVRWVAGATEATFLLTLLLLITILRVEAEEPTPEEA